MAHTVTPPGAGIDIATMVAPPVTVEFEAGNQVVNIRKTQLLQKPTSLLRLPFLGVWGPTHHAAEYNRIIKYYNHIPLVYAYLYIIYIKLK